MVLLGLVVGIAVTTVGSGNQQKELQNEVNRLHAVLRMASEEAIFSNTEIGVLVDNEHYEFLVYDEEKRQWKNAEQAFLRSYKLPEWVTVDFLREGRERKMLGDETGDSSLSEGKSLKPQFMLLSSGEVTGFRIGLQIDADADSRREILTNEQGEIVLADRES